MRIYKPQNTADLIAFDLTADIIPGEGAGGTTFKHALRDFEYTLVWHQFEVDDTTRVIHEYEGMFDIRIQSMDGSFKVYLNLFTGAITSMVCSKGYTGKLLNGHGIGSKMSDLLKTDNTWGFDLDHSFFVRYPFDGIIIHPPHQLVDEIYNVHCGYDGPSPDFEIETIELVEMELARIFYADTLFH